jgi:hypothetical protein
MKYAVEMGSGVMIYTPKIGSGIHKVIWGGGGGFKETQRAWCCHKPTLIFSK